ncbi:hypothetical protein [Bradyrhizobium septentrionale]|uniref:Uncharacterized protein n=1 Tax=Bradyrhizobium septentrionale TaxID=1404411 RepID=A0A974A0K5_9BRAD|nr:hypothetical protein [Bradyrhizobium septentrionale]UGY12098.1 hypothetical protein HAP48_0025465 [Bradyrhizobium septentrionale]UGY29284.1 hypothetical protein HU675_0022670 [Bradyrhizobium septentrionale]
MNVSEQQSEPVSGQTGAETAAKSEPVMAAAEATRLAPDQEETSPKADAPRMDAPKVEFPKVEPPKVEPRVDAMVEPKIDPKVEPKIEPTNMDEPKVEAGKREEPRFPGKLMIMAPGDRTWDHEATASKPGAEQAAKPAGTRRIGAMAAVIALAIVAGAIGGALATAGLGHLASPAIASAQDTAAKDAAAKETADASLARLESEIAALKASVEQTAKAGQAQFSKASDRIEKVEKALAEPNARLAKLSETVDKLRATPQTTVAAATPVREVTGSVPPATAAAAPAAPKPEVGRMPVVDGWSLRDVGNGGALIEGRGGIYEVYAGDPVPGLGRVDAIRKQDGRWVVVTSKGLIVSR